LSIGFLCQCIIRTNEQKTLPVYTVAVCPVRLERTLPARGSFLDSMDIRPLGVRGVRLRLRTQAVFGQSAWTDCDILWTWWWSMKNSTH